MATTLHSFIDIFDASFGEGADAVRLRRIVIPIIQRDYAQGREGEDVERVRNRFLESLYKAVTEKPITLDFVYGDIDEQGNMTPLDGQQRLTTLFLLHWYAAKKGNVPEEEWDFLKRFSYETRYSARDFCTDLVGFTPEFKSSISKEIVNQAWFPLDWKKDPTVSSMLVMLDAIHGKFGDVPNLWDRFKEKCITFYFLPIKDMGMTDELYIKMNSRGKPLTAFEHFKAEFEREIRNVDDAAANRIMRKIDCKWTDLLWEYRNSGTAAGDNTIDDEFLCYFKFICDVICYRNGQSPSRSDDEFGLLRLYFSPKCLDAAKNIATLESFFDCWCAIPGYKSPTDFLTSFMSDKHEEGKILVEPRRYGINIFEDCLRNYSDKKGRARQFPLNRMVLLYAIIVYLQNAEKITETDFRRRIRIVNNLIQNSEDEVSDRADRNRMTAILAETDAIILTGAIDDSVENSFNANQLAEEKQKNAFLESEPEMAETLFELEDHPLLKGQIAVVGLENLECAKRFESLFGCDLDKVDCAMMATGDYGQVERNKWRHQYGSTIQSAWFELFHRSSNDGFDKTKGTLVKLLKSKEAFSDGILQEIADDYLRECEANSLYPFVYYYIKYKEYRPGAYGKMHNNSVATEPYMFLVMQTKTYLSPNSYYPYLKAASDDEHLSKDDLGRRLVFGDEHIVCTNSGYLRRKNEDDTVVDTIAIKQNSGGIDTEDRIVLLRKYIKENF